MHGSPLKAAADNERGSPWDEGHIQTLYSDVHSRLVEIRAKPE